MTVTSKQQSMLKQLKDKIHRLQAQEKQTKKKLRFALSQARKHGVMYKRTLAKKADEMQRKLQAAKKSSYADAIREVEMRVRKELQAKAQLLVNVLCHTDKRMKAKKKSKR